MRVSAWVELSWRVDGGLWVQLQGCPLGLVTAYTLRMIPR